MNNLVIILTVLFCRLLAGGEEACVNDKPVRGYIVQSRDGQINNTSEAIFILRLTAESKKTHMILLYSPYRFGFDAPAPRPEQYLPVEMFTDRRLEWEFDIRNPDSSEEIYICECCKKGMKTGDSRIPEQVTMIQIPGREHEKVPNRKKLPCMVVTGWRKLTNNSR